MKMKIKFFSLLIIFSLILVACGERTEDGILFKTADPRLNIGFKIPQAVDAPALPTVTPAVVPEVVPAEEVGEVEPEPPTAEIKGNISSSGEKIYHVPGGAYYDQVKIDEAAGEAWFVTAEEAEAAGFRRASR
jgi:hypothetical protein